MCFQAATGITLEEEAIPHSSDSKANQTQHSHKKKLEEHVTTIAEAASKKMKLELTAKTKEMKRLVLEKEESVETMNKISAELGAVHELIGEDRGFLRKFEEEESVNQKRIEVLQQRNEELTRLKGGRHTAVKLGEEKVLRLERQHEEAKVRIVEVEKKIADLPTATADYSQEMLSILEKQIAVKRRELECPICFEESTPPIYTCVAQHLICAKCR